MANQYLIKGGTPLSGTTTISGSKNSALPIMAATLLTDEQIVLHNIPHLRDIATMIQLLETLGKKITRTGNSLIIDHEKSGMIEAPYDIVKQMRASICVLGPILAREKKAKISFPGGCVFGPRPINLHLEGLKKIGATIENHHGFIQATCDELIGTKVNLLGEFGTSVLATDNIISAAVLASGTTIIENAAKEPETEDLIHFLNHLGAKIKGAGNSKLEIEGVDKLHGGEYTIIQDRIEAGTFIIFTALTEGEVTINYNYPQHIKTVLDLCQQINMDLKINDSSISILPKKLKELKAFTLTTLPYPFFPTDLQPLFLTLATLIQGNSTLTEKIYPNRFSHSPELIRMGAQIHIEQQSAIITGKEYLEGAVVQASDLRGCAALIAAGLAAKGTTEITRIYHGERGYEKIENKISDLGGNIKVTPETTHKDLEQPE